MPHRIYLVEDHPVMQEAYADVLGAEPDLALCGVSERAEEALERIQGAPCDLVVTDVRLPGMSGIDLVERLAAACPTLPVVVITGHDDVSFERRARAAGAVAFLPKRQAALGLVPTIRSVLAGAGRAEAPE